MRTLILITIFLFWTNTKAKTCSCFPQFYQRSFCQTFQEESNVLTVIRAKILNKYHWGNYVEVLDNLHNTANKDTIVVWGDNGVLCRGGVGNIGDTVILSIMRTDLWGNEGLEEPIELEEDYMMPSCGTYRLRYKNGIVIGFYLNYFGPPDTISYLSFVEGFQQCVFVSKKHTLENSNTTVSPNPTGDKLTFISDQKILEFLLYDLSGNKLLDKRVNTTSVDVDLRKYELESGIYVAILNMTSGNRVVRKIVYTQE